MPNKSYSSKIFKQLTVEQKYEIVKTEIEDNLKYWWRTPADINWSCRELFESHNLYISEAAAALGDTIFTEDVSKADATNMWKKLDSKKVRWEHMVPSSVILSKAVELVKEGKFTIDAYKDLCSIGNICICTLAEDDKLNKNKLRSAMPDGWDSKNPWARYEAVDIKFKKYIF